MNKKVISYYDFFKTYLETYKELHQECFSWYVLVCNKDKNVIERTGRSKKPFNANRLQQILNSGIVKTIIAQGKEIAKKLNKIGVRMIFEISITISDRTFTMSNKDIREINEVVGITTIYYKECKCLFSDHYSKTLAEFNLEYCIAFLNNGYATALKILAFDELKRVPLNTLVHFNAFPSAILNHELFGHYFEEDSDGGKKQISDIVIEGKPDIYDDPRATQAGFCSFDDCGNFLGKTVLVDKGKIQKSSVIRNQRAGEKKILSRMTNVIVRPNIFFEPGNMERIEVYSVRRAKLHKTAISIYVNASYFYKNNQYRRLPSFKIDFSVNELLQNIKGYGNDKCFFSTTECIKRGDYCGGVGGISPDIYICI